MTKEELEKEADKWLVTNLHSTEEDYKQAYLAGAEPREKRIAELEEKIADSNKAWNELVEGWKEDYKELEKENEKLKEQIENMKCCGNCDFIFRDGNCYYDKECKNKDHWSLRR